MISAPTPTAVSPSAGYRGRLAPSPTGWLHAGHARTFTIAWQRAEKAGGTCILRMEDLDSMRCKPAFAESVFEDLAWLGLDWNEGPDRGGPHAPYTQSARLSLYQRTWKTLLDTGHIYPSPHSRRDVRNALSAPHGNHGEAPFPRQLRAPRGTGSNASEPGPVNWRFRVPDGEMIAFTDGRRGVTRYLAGQDFGDFLVWRKDGFPSYEFAVVVDDHHMRVTEVVRGEDLLLSTARQLLLYRALEWVPPAWYHCALVRDQNGQRLAKRTDAHSIRAMRRDGVDPQIFREWLIRTERVETHSTSPNI